MNPKTYSRRRFLVGAGGATILLPFLPSLGCKGVTDPSVMPNTGTTRQALTAPKSPPRFIVVKALNGTCRRFSRPDLYGNKGIHNASTTYADDGWAPLGLSAMDTLQSLKAANFTDMMSPLLPHLDTMLQIDGMSMRAGENDYTNAHTASRAYALVADNAIDTNGVAVGGNVSIDQLIAQGFTKSGIITSQEAVHLGYNWDQSSGEMSYVARGQRVSRYGGVRQAYLDILAPPLDPAHSAQLIQRKSVIGSLNSEYMSLRGRLSSADQSVLDQHIAVLSDTEQRLTAQFASATGCATYPPNYGGDFATYLQFMQTVLACDATRVMTLIINDLNAASILSADNTSANFPDLLVPNTAGAAASALVKGWKDPNAAAALAPDTNANDIAGEMTRAIDPNLATTPQLLSQDYHGYWAHNGLSNPTVVRNLAVMQSNKFKNRLVASLIAMLKATPSVTTDNSSATCMDNTVVLFFNEFDDGGHHNYAPKPLPYVLFAGAQTGFNTGYINYSPTTIKSQNITTTGPQPHNRLLTTLAQHFGLTTWTDPVRKMATSNFGNPDYAGDGILKELKAT